MKKNIFFIFLFFSLLYINKLPAQDRSYLNEWGLQNLYMYLNETHFEVLLKNGGTIKIDTLAGGFVWAKIFIDDIIITNKKIFLVYHNIYYKNKEDFRALPNKDTIDLETYTQHQLLAKKDTFYFVVEMNCKHLIGGKEKPNYYVFNTYPTQKKIIPPKEHVVFTKDSLNRQMESYSLKNLEISNFSIRNSKYKRLVPLNIPSSNYSGIKAKKLNQKIALSLKESIVISFSPCPWCTVNNENRHNECTYFYKEKQWHTPIMYPNRVYW